MSFFLFSLIFTLWPAEMEKSTIRQVLSFFFFLFSFFFFLLTLTRSGLLAEIRWSVFSKSKRISYISISRTDSDSFHIPFGRMVKFQFLAQFPMDYLPLPAVSSIIFVFRQFAAFANYLIYHNVINVVIIIYSLEFFTSVLADGLSLEFEWQQVSSSLQDYSQYSSHSQ